MNTQVASFSKIIQYKILILLAFFLGLFFVLALLLFAFPKNSYAVSYCGSPDSGTDGTIQRGVLYTSGGAIGTGNECSSGLPSQGGSFQIVPQGHALTAIGYGSDDLKCMIGISTAPVRADGTVDFSQTDYNQFDYCTQAPGARNRIMVQYEHSPYDDILRSWGNYQNQYVPAGHIVTGWIWGANTSGGIGTSAGNPAQECYYQEYMNLQTKQVFGWGSQYDGTCNEYGYGNVNNLQRVARAPAGRVITGIDFVLDQDANVRSMYVATRKVGPPAQPASFDLQIAPAGGLDIIRGASATGTFVVSVTNCQGPVTSVDLNSVQPNRVINDITFSFSRTTVPCTPGDNQAILTVRPGPSASPLSLPDGPYADIGLRISGSSNGFSNYVDTGLWVYERPTVSITANGSSGPVTINTTNTLTIGWAPLNTKNGTACTASNAWNGAKSSNHGQTYSQNITGLPAGNYVFSISCLGVNNVSSTVASVSVTVTGTPPPISKLDTLTISPQNSTINVGATQSYTLTATYTNGAPPQTVTLSTNTNYVSLDGSFVTMGSGSNKNIATGNTPTSTPARVQATYFENYTDGTTVTRTVTANLAVSNPGYSLVCPNGLTVNNNNTQTLSVPVSVSPASGSNVSFTAAFTSGPSPRPSLNPVNGTLGSSNFYSTIIAVGINNTIQAGTYNLQVNATRSSQSAVCNVPITVNIAADQLISLDIFPKSQQFVRGEGFDYSAVGTYRRSDNTTYTTNVTTSTTFTSSTSSIIFSGNRATSQIVGNGVVTGRIGTVSAVTGFNVADFDLACPKSTNLTLTGATLPAGTTVNLSFTLNPLNGYSRSTALQVSNTASPSLFSPNPRVQILSFGNYTYNMSVDMSGRGAGTYTIVGNLNYTNPSANPPFSKAANGSPCTFSINVGAVTNYDLTFDSIIGSVMQDDDSNAGNNVVGGPMIHQYKIQLGGCSGGAVTNGIELKPLTLNAVSGVEWGYYEETSPGNFVNRGQNIAMACGQTRYLRINAKNNLAPLNANNTPLSNQPINFVTGTPGIGDKQHNLVIGVYGRPVVTSFTATPNSLNTSQSSVLAWKTAFVPVNGNYCMATGGTSGWIGVKYNSPPPVGPGGTYTASNMPAGSHTFSIACGVIFRNSLYYSAPVSTTVNVSVSPSNQPINVVGDNSTCGKIFVKWSKPGSGTAPTAYNVYRFVGSSWVLITTINVTNSAQVDYTFQDPSPSPQNYYAVSSMQGATESAKTPASNNPTALVSCTSNPPQNVVGDNNTCGKIFVKWQKPGSGLAPTAYKVYKWTVATGVWTVIANINVTNAAQVDYSFEDPSPSPALNYYSVSSMQGAVESVKVAASNNPVPLLSCTPNKPTITNISSACSGISITWSYTGSIALSRFRIYRNGVQLTEVPSGQTGYTDPTPKATNDYQVSAISAAGIESPKSDTVSQAFTGCIPNLNNSDKQITFVNNDANVSGNAQCVGSTSGVKQRMRIDDVLTFRIDMCNSGTGAITATAASPVVIEDLLYRLKQPTKGGWQASLRQGGASVPCTSAGINCRLDDSLPGKIRFVIRTGTLPANNGVWSVTFKAQTYLEPNSNITDPRFEDKGYFHHKDLKGPGDPSLPITRCTITPGCDTQKSYGYTTGLQVFYTSSEGGPKVIEIPPGN